MNVWKEYENRQNNGLVAFDFLSTSLMHEKKSLQRFTNYMKTRVT